MVLYIIVSELGRRQHCRDNVTMFSGHKLFAIALCLYSLWRLYVDSETLTFVEFLLVLEALLLCFVVALSLS